MVSPRKVTSDQRELFKKWVFSHNTAVKLLFLSFTGNITKLPEAEKFKKRARRPKASNANIHGAYKNQTMFEETRTILYQFYKPFNRALAQLLNDSRFDYGPF